jgi:heptosyltransferase-3
MAGIGKSLERSVRRATIAWLGRGGSRRERAAELALPSAPSFLLIRPDRIGDAIISTPLLMLLRERFPAARIDMLLGRKNRSAAELLPEIDGHPVLAGSTSEVFNTIRTIRGRRYDVAINLLANDSASGSLLMALSGARVRIGFRGEAEGVYDYVVEKPSTPIHIVRESSLLLAPLGISPIGEMPSRESEHLRIEIPDDALQGAKSRAAFLFTDNSRHRLIMNISGSSPEKFWGVEQYIELALRLRARGTESIIAGSPGDSQKVAAIAAGAGCSFLPPTPSLAEFAAMLSRADLIVTPDTSVVHLSAALRKPTVMLVASESAGSAWHPWGTRYQVVRHKESIPEIPVEEVERSIEKLIR